MNIGEIDGYAKQMQVQVGGGITSGSAMQSLANSKQQPMRERVQGCHERARGIIAMLANLTSAMIPPSSLANVGQGTEHIKDSTLSGDIDDLSSAIVQIEAQVSRLSIAITGAA